MVVLRRFENYYRVRVRWSQTGRRFESPEELTSGDVFANVRPGGYIPEEQIKDMDLDGIDVSILYPTLASSCSRCRTASF